MRKKSQISNELLLLIGLVLIVFGIMYGYSFYQSKKIDLVNRQLRLQNECNKLAKDIVFVSSMGGNFRKFYDNTKYDLVFTGSSRQLSVSDTVTIATCKIPVMVRKVTAEEGEGDKGAGYKFSDEIDFELGTGKLTIGCNKNKVYVGLGELIW